MGYKHSPSHTNLRRHERKVLSKEERHNSKNEISKYPSIHPISPMTDEEIDNQLALVASVDGDAFPEWDEPSRDEPERGEGVKSWEWS